MSPDDEKRPEILAILLQEHLNVRLAQDQKLKTAVEEGALRFSPLEAAALIIECRLPLIQLSMLLLFPDCP
jgi:hypothetical protein